MYCIGGWRIHRVQQVLPLKQPVGAGFSYGEPTEYTSEGAAKDMDVFLQLFLAEYPDYQTPDFHITGESYAG